MKFIFEGEPIAKVRHRVGKKGMYDPQSEAKGYAKVDLFAQVCNKYDEFRTEMPLVCDISVSMSFYFTYPKKLSQSKIKAILENKETYPHIIKPDIDNLVKFYLDVGNGILYKDDKQIVSLHCTKSYSTISRVEMEITYSKE